MNKTIKIFLIVLLLSYFSCDEAEKIEYGHFKEAIAMESISENDHNTLLVLDNLSNQLFYYDNDSKCMYDFNSEMPNQNGIVLPKFPYYLKVSNDKQKTVVLSASKRLTIINNEPLFTYYKEDCEQIALPNVEAEYQLDKLPTSVILEKGVDSLYKLTLIYNKIGKIEILNYNNEVFTLLETKEFNKEINGYYSFDNRLYFSFKGENKLVKLATETEEEEDILFNDDTINNISKFIINDKFIFLYDDVTDEIMIWNKENSSFEDIENNLNPLDSTSNSKKFKLSYPLTNMKFYTQKYNVKSGDFLNGLGYLNVHQLLEGEYVILTDNAGYLFFITISSDYSLIKDYSEDDYETLDEYKEKLNKRFLKFHSPLRDDYEIEASGLLQSSYCNQFNKYEADICFYPLEPDEDNEINRYVILTEEAKNRAYTILGDLFTFIYEGVVKDTTFSDGSFKSSDIFFSTKLDLSSIKIAPEKLMLEITSSIPEDKENDSKCPALEDGKTIVLPIISANGHDLTLDITSYPNVASCFDEAFVFNVRVNNMFLISASKSDYYDVLSYCTTDPEINTLCPGENCPKKCDEEGTTFENDLFKVKLFSDKGEIPRDTTLSFYLSETSDNFKYNYAMVSPTELLFTQQDKDSESKYGIYLLDQFNNNVLNIDSNYWGSVKTTIK